MARPRGEIREALHRALAELGSGGSAATVKQLAGASLVGYKVARETLKDMARAGEAEVVGYDKPAGEVRWMAMYSLADSQSAWPQPWAGIETMANALRPNFSADDQ